METDAALTNYLDTKKKIDDLLALPRITHDHTRDLSQIERECFEEVATETLRNLKGEARDNFLDKIASLNPSHARNVWDYNHRRISSAIAKLIKEQGFMPSVNDIAEEAGLSRQAVSRHLKEYKTSPGYLEEMEQFKFMASKLIASVFKSAVNGDMKASKLYLETVGVINKKSSGGTVVNEQNNYIQVNNTILSQENLKKLSAEQLNQIELIVTGNSGGMSK